MVNCPNCGKVIDGPGYEFGDVIKMLCYSCSCGANVVYQADSPKVLKKKLKKLLDSPP